MRLALIKKQIDWVDNWTSKLILDLKEEDWGVESNVQTSINWQVGHLIISKYFHAVQSVLNKDNKIITNLNLQIPLNDFFTYYFAGSNPLESWKGRPNKMELLEYKKTMDKKTSLLLEEITENNLDESTAINNPVAKTKYDALSFSYKHQMWHNGQIAMIKRIKASKNTT